MLKRLIALLALCLAVLMADDFFNLEEAVYFAGVGLAVFAVCLLRLSGGGEERSFMYVACRPPGVIPLNESGTRKKLL